MKILQIIATQTRIEFSDGAKDDINDEYDSYITNMSMSIKNHTTATSNDKTVKAVAIDGRISPIA